MGLLDDTHLLRGEVAQRLFSEVAAPAPVIDFHNHLSPKVILENRPFRSLTEAWLDGDHYKWRAMRGAGIPERLITGGAEDRERFRAWAGTVPQLAMNPLYAWTHLELKRVFGIETPLSAQTADQIYDAAADRLQEESLHPQGILRRFGTQVACTTDDPADSLDNHEALRDALPDCRVLPTFRPDRAMDIGDPRAYDAYLTRLAEASGLEIRSPSSLLAALEARHSAFHKVGCRASDHGLENMPSVPFDGAAVERIWQRVRAGRVPSTEEATTFSSWLLHELALLDHARGWVSQFHLGALRNLNTTRQRDLGPDVGSDAIGLPLDGRSVARFLDDLERSGQLPRTILYGMRPADAPMLASIAGAFGGSGGEEAGRSGGKASGGSGGQAAGRSGGRDAGGQSSNSYNQSPVPSRVQPGAAWWFSDTESGIRQQLRVVAEIGVLGRWVGMVTDSRSLLSLTRHEYFRRILCDELDREVSRGLLPDDDALLVPLVEAVCFRNAQGFFGFDEDRSL